MSSRIRSDFGTLGERLAVPAPRVRHVEVREGALWQPGLLIEWLPGEQGWLARAAWIRADAGELVVAVVPADCVRPASGGPSEPSERARPPPQAGCPA